MLECKVAHEDDWPILKTFYARAYRENHPLHNRRYWRWRFGDPDLGKSYICLDRDTVAGHVGASFTDGFSWMVSAYNLPEYRGRGVMGMLYEFAGKHHPHLVTTNANLPCMNFYRKIGWIRYSDLERYALVNPEVHSKEQVCSPAELREPWEAVPDGHYWQQPGLKSVILPDGTTAVNQLEVGGLRLADIVDPERVAELAWQAGAKWVDYITSWNDPLCRALPALGWQFGDDCQVPWNLNPVEWGSKANVSYLAQYPMPHDFIVKRYHCDHGRVGSLPAED